MPDKNPPISRALLSVSNKDGIVDFARALHDKNVALVSTGGTKQVLEEAGLPVQDVAELTGFAEIMDGRVKTLHPLVHGGLLAKRGKAEHEAAMQAHDILPIDMLVVNLYPFEKTLAAGGDYAACVENIDIGGPAMVRAAAKNHESITVLVDAGDYADVLAEMDAHKGATSFALRQKLAQKAFARVAVYDAAISNWLAGEVAGETAPAFRAVGGTLQENLRYGENPHQQAGFYVTDKSQPSVAGAEQLQGKALSYNNINDTDAAFALVCAFDPAEAVCAIIKHANPCGVALGANVADAFTRALACDAVSAYGGIIAVNQMLDAAMVKAMGKLFVEVIIAPDVSEEARAMLAEKKNLRVLRTGGLADPLAPALDVRSVGGGLLVQNKDIGRIETGDVQIVSQRKPSEQEMRDMVFAFRVAKYVKSNAIIYAKDGATVGIGAGQMSRVDSARIAVRKAEDAAQAAGEKVSPIKGSVVASDAFFPFADGLLAAAQAGATAIIQPGGSKRDAEIIAAADAEGLAMVFTGMRHFRH